MGVSREEREGGGVPFEELIEFEEFLLSVGVEEVDVEACIF